MHFKLIDGDILDPEDVTCRRNSFDGVIVSVIGKQGTGKSTLLNRLFGTSFLELDRSQGLRSTTRGIDAAFVDNDRYLLLDVEGIDSVDLFRARKGHDIDQYQAKLMALIMSISDLIIFNIPDMALNHMDAFSPYLWKSAILYRSNHEKQHHFQMVIAIRDFPPEANVADAEIVVERNLSLIAHEVTAQCGEDGEVNFEKPGISRPSESGLHTVGSRSGLNPSQIRITTLTASEEDSISTKVDEDATPSTIRQQLLDSPTCESMTDFVHCAKVVGIPNLRYEAQANVRHALALLTDIIEDTPPRHRWKLRGLQDKLTVTWSRINVNLKLVYLNTMNWVKELRSIFEDSEVFDFELDKSSMNLGVRPESYHTLASSYFSLCLEKFLNLQLLRLSSIPRDVQEGTIREVVMMIHERCIHYIQQFRLEALQSWFRKHVYDDTSAPPVNKLDKSHPHTAARNVWSEVTSRSQPLVWRSVVFEPPDSSELAIKLGKALSEVLAENSAEEERKFAARSTAAGVLIGAVFGPLGMLAGMQFAREQKVKSFIKSLSRKNLSLSREETFDLATLVSNPKNEPSEGEEARALVPEGSDFGSKHDSENESKGTSDHQTSQEGELLPSEERAVTAVTRLSSEEPYKGIEAPSSASR